MSKKTEVEAMREQVIRLTERLEEAGDAVKLTALIEQMQLQAKAQQEEVEHLRTFKAKWQTNLDQGAIDQYKLTQPLKRTISEQQTQITRLTADNTRLKNRLDEIAKGTSGL